jgi:hypothetical protein
MACVGTGEQEDVRVPMSSRRTSEPQHGGRCKEWLRGLPRPIYWSAKLESGAIVLAKSRHKISDLAPHDLLRASILRADHVYAFILGSKGL